MSMSDPIADFLTRIRNAHMAKKDFVDIPSSNIRIRILYVLKEEKFIRDYILIKNSSQKLKTLRVFLKYDDNDFPVIHGIDRVSSPGCRRYVSYDKIPKVLNGLGVSIVTTSKGVMSNKKAKKLKVGGEVLCNVW